MQGLNRQLWITLLFKEALPLGFPGLTQVVEFEADEADSTIDCVVRPRPSDAPAWKWRC